MVMVSMVASPKPWAVTVILPLASVCVLPIVVLPLIDDEPLFIVELPLPIVDEPVPPWAVAALPVPVDGLFIVVVPLGIGAPVPVVDGVPLDVLPVDGVVVVVDGVDGVVVVLGDCVPGIVPCAAAGPWPVLLLPALPCA